MARSVSDLSAALAIDKTALDDEVIRQPVLFYEVSEALVTANAERDGAKEELATVDADQAATFRRKLSTGKDRVTDSMVQAAVQSSSAHERAVTAYLDAKASAERLQVLKEAFQQRSYMLRDLVSLYSANYYEEASMKPTKAQEASHYSANRARIANAREAKQR